MFSWATGSQTDGPKRGPTISTGPSGSRSRASSHARPIALSETSKHRIETFMGPSWAWPRHGDAGAEATASER
jgi:hypothetical protein